MNAHDRYKPTRLYIKEHRLTGLLYFGKSQKNDLDSYPGSGRRWLRHIDKHGRDHVVNLWISDWFYNSYDIEEFALFFSAFHNIVEDPAWANLKEENGLDTGGCYSNESKKKKGITIRRTKSTQEYKETTGKEAGRKSSEIQNSKEFKERTHKKCEHCGKTISAGNYVRWHGINCKVFLGEEKYKEKLKPVKDKENETKSSEEWRNNVWLPAMQRLSDIKATQEWKDGPGKEATRKQKEKMAKKKRHE